MASPPILLGVPDAPVETTSSWELNKIGGKPDAMTPLPSVMCAGCGEVMVHVMQVYCPLGLSTFHRVLHMYACSSRSCWNTQHGWRVYRSQVKDTSLDGAASSSRCPSTGGKVSSETSDWCDDADDWGSDDEASNLVAMVTDTKLSCPEMEKEDPGCVKCPDDKTDKISEEDIVSEMEELTVEMTDSGIPEVCVEDEPGEEAITNALSYLATNSDGESVTSGRRTVFQGPQRHFKSFYLDVFDEPAENASDSLHVTALLKDYERRERVNVNLLLEDIEMSGGKGGRSEKYEKTEIKHGDKCLHKFMKRLKVCPEQVVRYQYGGHPLPLCPLTVSPAPCSTCHAPRVFEMQLVPPLIPYLRYHGESEPAVEFGTVVVYTCSASCWQEKGEGLQEGLETSPREEFVLVQADPDQHLFKI